MIKDFAGSVLSSLESLFIEFNYRKLLFWVFVLFAIIITFVMFENLTGYAYFSRMERKVAILKSLNELAKDDISSKPELNSIYQDTIFELKSYKVEPFSLSRFFSGFGIITPKIPFDIWKFISGGFLGFMAAIAVVANDKKLNFEFLGIFVFGLVMGIVGIFIPTIYNIWINYIGFPIIQFIILILLARMRIIKFRGIEFRPF